MKSLTYFEQLEKIIYKSILKNNKEMLIFLKTEEKKKIAKLSIDDLNNLLFLGDDFVGIEFKNLNQEEMIEIKNSKCLL